MISAAAPLARANLAWMPRPSVSLPPSDGCSGGPTEWLPSKQVSGCGSEPPFRQDRRCGLPRESSTDDV